jgi:hypothetical protein
MSGRTGIKNFDCLNKKFGLLTVIDIKKINNRTQAVCKCDCGNIRNCNISYLKKSKSNTCGCKRAIHASNAGKLSVIHKKSHTRLYQIWENIKQRCLNKNFKRYDNYGGRGIEICEEWLKFINFNNWAINNGYEETLTIDRIDNMDNYCPSNCRWITNFEQQSNTRRTVKLTYMGETHHISEWARIINTSRSNILYRIKANKPIDQILSSRLLINKK